ncbi:MAG: cation:proton antiporter, partial [Planctomycetota bacterium]
MHTERLFLADLALVLCVAAVTTVVFRRLRQPVVLGYLLAGVIVGPHTPTPLFLFADQKNLEVLSELGVILVMFAIGLEFSLRRLVAVLPRAGPVAALQLGAMLALGYGTGRLLGWSSLQSLFAGAIVSISSTMIIARVLAEQPLGRELSELVL